MGIEHTFLRHILDAVKAISTSIRGRIIPTFAQHSGAQSLPRQQL
jgi:hypothetical protein